MNVLIVGGPADGKVHQMPDSATELQYAQITEGFPAWISADAYIETVPVKTFSCPIRRKLDGSGVVFWEERRWVGA